MQRWKCLNCGYRLETAEPPNQCPGCQLKCTWIDDNCYTPECGLIEGEEV